MQIFDRLRRLAALLPLLLPLAGVTQAEAATRTQAANVIPLVALAAPGVTDPPLSIRSELLLANDGNFYFTSSAGGKGLGTISRMTPGGTLSVVYAMDNSDQGASSFARLTQASDGDLYGTMFLGGTRGRGTVFKVTLSGTYTTLHSFDERNKGPALPYSGVVEAADGNLYGTTLNGGASDMGTVYRISKSGSLSVIHEFSGDDGQNPEGTLVAGADGKLYGTTLQGGSGNRGAIYRISTSGTFERLYSFPALGAFTAAGLATNATGANPRAGLLLGADGNFYGTAYQGGVNGYGTVFRVTPSGTLTVLHAFTGPSYGGAFPLGGVAQDAAGNLYGTTERGGYLGSGSAWRIDTGGQFALLHGFTGLTTDGSQPYAGLTVANGQIYGVTYTDVFSNAGAIFKLDPGTGGVLPLEFAISDTAITRGATVQLTWSGPPGSTCTRIGSAWGSGQDTGAPVAGTESQTPATAGLYTFILSCTDTSQVVHSAYANVVVSAPPLQTVDGGDTSGGGGSMPLLALLLLAILLTRKFIKETASPCP